MIRYCAGLLLAALAATASATGAADWKVWVARMDKAQQSLNYDATLIIDQDQRWDLIELSQRIGPAGPEQQAATLNGERRRFLRTAQGLSVLGPEGNRSLAKGPELVSDLVADQLADTYEVSLEGPDRIAGRSAMRLLLHPTAEDRYGLRLWLDVDTGLPLRSERLRSDGSVLERRMITRLSVLGFAGVVTRAAPPVGVHSQWSLPSGFRLMGDAIAVPGIVGARHWVVSDGVAWVSIYQLPASQGQPTATGWRRGAIGQVSMRTGDSWVYVLGDLPNATLERLGEAALAAERQP